VIKRVPQNEVQKIWVEKTANQEVKAWLEKFHHAEGWKFERLMKESAGNNHVDSPNQP
jgi:hypothetical protein